MNQVQNPAGDDASNVTNEETQTDTNQDESQNLNNQNTDADKLKEIAENQRIRAEKAEAQLKKLSEQSTEQKPQEFDPSLIEKTLDQKLAERDLQSLEYPDEIKEQIKRVADISGVDVRQAASDPYIQSLVQEHERAEKVKAASPDTSGKQTTSYSFDPSNPPDVDLTTPEGQEAQLNWEKQLERHNNSR